MLSQDTVKMAASVALATASVLYVVKKISDVVEKRGLTRGCLTHTALGTTGAFVAYKAGQAALDGGLPPAILAVPAVGIICAETALKKHKP